MVSFLRKLTGEDPTLSKVADHIQYVGERIGYEHVGIGSDFDGTMRTPLGLEDVSKFPFLIAELLGRGMPEEFVKGILGQNVLRVLDKVQEVSAAMMGKVEILHDHIEPLWSEAIREEVRQARGISK